MKKTYRVEFTIKNDTSEAKDILEPFKNSKALKSWLIRKLVNTYSDVYNLREIDPTKSLRVQVVEIKGDEQ
jgi:hypothetical protein